LNNIIQTYTDHRSSCSHANRHTLINTLLENDRNGDGDGNGKGGGGRKRMRRRRIEMDT
jgi:hypothetical protein